MEINTQAILDNISEGDLLEKNSEYERNAAKKAGKLPLKINEEVLKKLPRGERRRLGDCSHIYDRVANMLASNISDEGWEKERGSIKALLGNLESILIALNSTRTKFRDASVDGSSDAQMRSLSDLEAKHDSKVRRIVAGVTEALEQRRVIPPDTNPITIMGGLSGFIPKWIDIYLEEGFEACFHASMEQSTPASTPSDREVFNRLNIAYAIRSAEAHLKDLVADY